jgi:hypothetical protein
MNSSEEKNEKTKKAEKANSEPSDVETGLLESSVPKSEETPEEIGRIDKKAAYKDLPNILILIGLYFLQGK